MPADLGFEPPNRPHGRLKLNQTIALQSNVRVCSVVECGQSGREVYSAWDLFQCLVFQCSWSIGATPNHWLLAHWHDSKSLALGALARLQIIGSWRIGATPNRWLSAHWRDSKSLALGATPNHWLLAHWRDSKLLALGSLAGLQIIGSWRIGVTPNRWPLAHWRDSKSLALGATLMTSWTLGATSYKLGPLAPSK